MAVVYGFVRKGVGKPGKAIAVTLIILLVLTAVFDNVIVGLSIVGYDSEKILGAYIGYAPIEDFMYAVLAVLIVPAIWHILGTKHVQ